MNFSSVLIFLIFPYLSKVIVTIFQVELTRNAQSRKAVFHMEHSMNPRRPLFLTEEFFLIVAVVKSKKIETTISKIL